MKKALGYAAALAVIGFVAAIAVVSVRIGRQSTLDEAHPADVILVLGAAEYRGRPSPVCARGWITRWNCTIANSPRE